MLQLEKKNRQELDWCEIPRESIHLGEKIGSELNVVTFRGRLLLENGSFATCVVKTCKGKFCCLREIYTFDGSFFYLPYLEYDVKFHFPDLPADRIVSTENEKHLLSELKVMTFLGSHLNILNMFGACTVKGEYGKNCASIESPLVVVNRFWSINVGEFLATNIFDWFT